jgi:predicted HTH transcriptional regulator
MVKHNSGTINFLQQGPTSYIKKLILEGEHQQLDFKFEISDSRKIAKTLVAFSNTDGGTLLIGVKDNGKISGVRSDEEFYMVQAAASMYCKPEIIFESKRWVVDGKTVLEVIITKGTNYPYFAQTEPEKWLAYIRVKDENILASAVHLKVWKNKTHDSGILMEYSDKVKKLLKYLELNTSISISKFCRMAFLPKIAAENILADLIYFGLIEIVYKDNHFIFCLRRKNFTDATSFPANS